MVPLIMIVSPNFSVRIAAASAMMVARVAIGVSAVVPMVLIFVPSRTNRVVGSRGVVANRLLVRAGVCHVIHCW
jgi:hypothetical protein